MWSFGRKLTGSLEERVGQRPNLKTYLEQTSTPKLLWLWSSVSFHFKYEQEENFFERGGREPSFTTQNFKVTESVAEQDLQPGDTPDSS